MPEAGGKLPRSGGREQDAVSGDDPDLEKINTLNTFADDISPITQHDRIWKNIFNALFDVENNFDFLFTSRSGNELNKNDSGLSYMNGIKAISMLTMIFGFMFLDLYNSPITKKSLDNYTCDYDLILKTILDEYDYMINEKVKIRRIGVYLGNLNKDKIVQLNLFKENKTDEELNRTLNYIKCKYGKNSILRAVSFQMDSLQKTRNVLIGGHNAE